MKKVLLIVFLVLGIRNVCAAELVNVYVFTQGGSEYCENALSFLRKLETEDFAEKINVIEYEVYNENWHPNALYVDVMEKIEKYHNEDVQGYPYIVVGNAYTVNGFDETYEQKIINGIEKEIEKPSKDIVADFLSKQEKEDAKDNIISIAVVASLVLIRIKT